MNRLHQWVCRSAMWQRHLHQTVLPWALASVDLGQNLLEIGPGPGGATEWLCQQHPRITAIELNENLARSLRHQHRQEHVAVVRADATRMPFASKVFTAAVAFTMLHHVPSHALQDSLLQEVFRTLKPGGIFAGTDSVASLLFRLFHLGDTCVPVNPQTFGKRLETAGFQDVLIECENNAFRFLAHRPYTD